MRPSRRLGTLVAAAALAATTGASPAHAYIDAGYGRVPTYVPQPSVSSPAHTTGDWPLVAVGGAAAVALAAGVALRSGVRSRARA
jgi:hypothetical protein